MDAGKFTYLGRLSVPNAGISVRCLTYRPDARTWFTITKGGQNKFELLEFTIPANTWSGSVQIVRNHGMLSSNNEFGMDGRQLVSMRSLLWDAYNNGLWASFGSFYANGDDLDFLAFIKFNSDGTKTVTLHENATFIHSDLLKGGLIEMPELLEWQTGCRFMAFGSRGSTSQRQSWGIGACAIEKPPYRLPFSQESDLLIHWPMKLLAPNVAVSDFPRDPADPPSAWVLPTGITPTPTYNQADAVHTMVQVDDAIMWFGVSSVGGCWYGGPNAQASRPSLLDPTKPMIGASPYHGLQAESYRAKWYLTSIESIASAFDAGNDQVAFDSVGNVATLGGVVPLQSQEMAQPYFDREQRLLYVPNLGAGNQAMPFIHVWSVAR